MKDVKDRNLEIGQTVAFSEHNTSSIYTGVIIRFTRLYVVLKDEFENESRKSPGYLLIIKD